MRDPISNFIEIGPVVLELWTREALKCSGIQHLSHAVKTWLDDTDFIFFEFSVVENPSWQEKISKFDQKF